ncbi:TPA: hypothetical protein DEP34_04145 [Candidatus Uhrbacteria bacterium]|uniref:Uncharacterized protein n=2 Tax=Candidatus Uhriibacteriota TaxID=1752732 RepID=A0A0G1Q5C9_9BACT|nr:MAG: hypothetical protein UX45_C0042G0002 [Candidatus Uhrbacteria bacterium GW2011_GWF2_46_218]KKU40042.1 MAG: hypothetical protein UX57_C0027G0002 [Candidatus Uhrbacteria bacterium GW2011_GWE2_46_68]HCB19543.1 hypothetical protein [Candidatus Uhrbacteria bacterium]
MNTQMVIASLESVLGRRVQTVRALKERDPKLFAQKSGLVSQALGPVVQRFRLNITKEEDAKRAVAISLILLNYILECQAAEWITSKKSDRDPLEVAGAFLRKYSTDALILAAIQRFDRLLTDMKDVWSHARIRVTEDCERWYGITDPETEATLHTAITRELLDAKGFPIGTHEEEVSLRDMIARVKEETRLAKLVHWMLVISPKDVSKFAAAQFVRRNPTIPNPIGGLWCPFLCSLLINAMGEGWGESRRCHTEWKGASGTERFVCVDLKTTRLFLHRLMLEPDLLPSSESVAKKFATVAFQQSRDIFKEACNEKDFYAILKMAGLAFERMVGQTREFYLQVVKDIEHVDDAELLSFWGHRLFAYVPGFDHFLLDENRTRLEKPWTYTKNIRDLEQLADAVARFDLWPPEERQRFADTFALEPLLRSYRHATKDAEALLRIWSGMRRADIAYSLKLTTRCRWSERSSLALCLCEKNESAFCVVEIREVIRRVAWTYQTIQKVLGSPLSYLVLADILLVGTAKYSLENWRSLIGTANVCSQGETLIIWEHLPSDLRKKLYTEFRPDHLAAWFLVNPPQVFRDFFEDLLQNADTETIRAHVLWARGISNLHTFAPGGTRVAIIDELWQRYLSRRF